MEKRLEETISGVRATTGITVDVYAEDGKYFYSPSGKAETAVPRSDKAVSDVLFDKGKNLTYFRLRYCGSDLVGVIEGSDSVNRNLALLIRALVENEAPADKKLTKKDFIKMLLSGDMNRVTAARYVSRFAVEKSPCFALSVSCEKTAGTTAAFLENFGSDTGDLSVQYTDEVCVYVRFCAEADDYRSADDFAAVLAESIYEELGVKADIGIGNKVENIFNVHESCQQCMAALKAAKTTGGEGVHSYREFILSRMIGEIPKYKLGEYLDMLLDTGARAVFEDEEMIKTGEIFLKNNLNVSETSDALYLHRNTLMYRLDKIEKATGLNIRKFSDAETFNLIVILMGIL